MTSKKTKRPKHEKLTREGLQDRINDMMWYASALEQKLQRMAGELHPGFDSELRCTDSNFNIEILRGMLIGAQAPLNQLFFVLRDEYGALPKKY